MPVTKDHSGTSNIPVFDLTPRYFLEGVRTKTGTVEYAALSLIYPITVRH